MIKEAEGGLAAASVCTTTTTTTATTAAATKKSFDRIFPSRISRLNVSQATEQTVKMHQVQILSSVYARGFAFCCDFVDFKTVQLDGKDWK
jgi:hypothetical protein